MVGIKISFATALPPEIWGLIMTVNLIDSYKANVSELQK